MKFAEVKEAVAPLFQALLTKVADLPSKNSGRRSIEFEWTDTWDGFPPRTDTKSCNGDVGSREYAAHRTQPTPLSLCHPPLPPQPLACRWW